MNRLMAISQQYSFKCDLGGGIIFIILWRRSGRLEKVKMHTRYSLTMTPCPWRWHCTVGFKIIARRNISYKSAWNDSKPSQPIRRQSYCCKTREIVPSSATNKTWKNHTSPGKVMQRLQLWEPSYLTLSSLSDDVYCITISAASDCQIAFSV